MPSESSLDAWKFLVGEWRGTSEGQFGEKGVIEDVAVFSLEPSERFIMGVGEAWCEGRLLNKNVSLMFYDRGEGKLKRKTFFSYGFVNQETECARTADEVRFEITMEPLPKEFEGTRWRSSLRRISDTEIATGLEMAGKDGAFKSYGETVLTKRA